jgi:hypothetical protein
MYKFIPFAVALVTIASTAMSQSNDAGTEPPAEVAAEGLLTQAELENLVAPVALFPDTLLIQILVASTNPMEVVKSDRLLTVNEGQDPAVIQAAVEAEEYDESVEVLAVAFPEVIEDMALHIEWTETMGDAMLAQTDDVMAAVQTMRTQAINSGALVSGEQQLVEVTEEEDVIIQPADPEVVYVPQYDPQVVYAQDNSNLVTDALTTGLITYGTFTVLDAIFDDDDDWDDYWGCRNCAGWGGGPIYRNPDVDIDVDGNVNIGNRVDLGDRDRDIDLSDRDINFKDRDIDIRDRDPVGGWRPDTGSKDKARDKIAAKRDADGKTKLPVNKSDGRGDALRGKLSGASGAPDISRPGADLKPEAVRKTMANRDLGGVNRDAVKVNRPQPSKAVKPKANLPTKKPSIKKPAAAKAPIKKASKPASIKKPKAIKKNSAGPKARKASSRGKKAGGKMKRRG